jgi:NAD(P)-dependent dehydrogenase (short-subunit alcohol dehydrogenase family)
VQSADLAAKELGGLHILVNALDTPAYGPAEADDDTAFDKIMENNLKTVWMSCQEGGRVMLRQGGGVIVNITSLLAERGVPNAALYCAAKAAVLNLTRALALEWARKGIRVNAIEAGWLDDESSPANKGDEFSKTMLKYLPYHRLVKPEELGGALLYLVSPAAGFVTGESIAVDGGLRAHV